jgi:hypothetical protein
MLFFLAGFGLAAHVLFWGLGPAILFTPSPWRRWWPVFVPAWGFAAQSAVVWLGAFLGLPGTDSYGRFALVIPAIFIAAAFWKKGRMHILRKLFAMRGLAIVGAGSLAVLLLPLSEASQLLTTISLGSCDAADYAAGARVLREFSSADRSGFLGLTEVVSIGSVDNFFDYWIRLNHFTPSALIAINGSVLGVPPDQLTGITNAVLAALGMPAVFWLARSGLGLGAAGSLVVGAVYVLGPLTWYAISHVAMGQLLAAPAIALLTWSGTALQKGARSRVRVMPWLLFLALVPWWLLLGAYNMVLAVAPAPLVLHALFTARRTGDWSRLAATARVLVVPLCLACVLFADRALGILERYQLLLSNDFGWRIPVLTPEGWIGAVSAATLEPYGNMPARVAICVGLAALLVLAWRVRRLQATGLLVGLVLPAVAGYGYLEWRGFRLGTNASYDAYKLLFIFLPGVLAALLSWMCLLRARNRWQRGIAIAGIAVVALLVVQSSLTFRSALRRPPLMVTPGLASLGTLEGRPEIASLNLLVPDMWSRLWANAFLLRVPHYFPTHTYEGRRNTPLRGEWDLIGGIVSIELRPGESLESGPGFTAVRKGGAQALSVLLESGWHDLEQEPRSGLRWRWTSGSATIRIANDTGRALSAELVLRDVRSISTRELELVAGGRTIATVAIDAEGRDLTVPGLQIPAGDILLSIQTPEPADSAGSADTRPLGFRIHGISLRVPESAGNVQ